MKELLDAIIVKRKQKSLLMSEEMSDGKHINNFINLWKLFKLYKDFWYTNTQEKKDLLT